MRSAVVVPSHHLRRTTARDLSPFGAQALVARDPHRPDATVEVSEEQSHQTAIQSRLSPTPSNDLRPPVDSDRGRKSYDPRT
jgi:hypothetical protein